MLRNHMLTGAVSAVVAAALTAGTIGVPRIAAAQTKPAPTSTAAKPPTAPAKPTTAKGPSDADKKKAGLHFKKGNELFGKKDWKGAKEEFLKAEEVIPAGTAEYHIGRCQEELGDYADAASWYDKALVTGKLKAEVETDAKKRSDDLKAKPAKVKITSDPAGATILVDGTARTEKTPAEIDLAPGSHKITLQLDKKKSVDQDVAVAAFTGGSVDVKLEDAPTTVAEDPFASSNTTTTTTTTTATTATTTDKPTTSKGHDYTWVYATGIGALAGFTVGGIFGAKALSDHSDFNKTPTHDIRDRGTRDALISDMGFGIGITLAVTSVVLYFNARSSGDTPPAASTPAPAATSSLSVAPVIGKSIGGLAASLAF